MAGWLRTKSAGQPDVHGVWFTPGHSCLGSNTGALGAEPPEGTSPISVTSWPRGVGPLPRTWEKVPKIYLPRGSGF